jgi:hypothetical protein
MSLATINTEYLASIVESLQDIAWELESLDRDSEINFYPVGTILKANPNNGRFKDSSVWVSLGDGKYRHLTGNKGLIANHDRLEGYTHVVFVA